MSVNSIEVIQILNLLKKNIINSITKLTAKTNSVSNNDADECLENFNFIKNLPIVRKLICENTQLKKQNSQLKKQNKRLEKLFLNII